MRGFFICPYLYSIFMGTTSRATQAPADGVRPQPPRGRPVSAKAAWRRLAALLRRRLSDGTWPAGTVLPSVRALAREFGTGKQAAALAVRALQQEGRIGGQERRRLIALQPEDACTLTGKLVLLASGNPLGLQHEDGWASEIYRGIFNAAGRSGTPLIVAHGVDLRTRLPLELEELPLQGVLLFGQMRIPLLRRYAQLGIPVVLVDRPLENVRIHSVSLDNVHAAADATARLIALGHRRIAFLRFIQMGLLDVDADAKERQRGYQRALREAGLEARPPRQSKAEEQGTVFNIFPTDRPGACPGIDALLAARPRFSAVVCYSTAPIPLLRHAAERANVKLPRDLSVVAFQAAWNADPFFAGPRADFERLGRKALELLQAPRRPVQQLRHPTVWHDGPSIAPPG
ncbi:MAG: hypothetical protein AMXMBFR7_34900 [Planctomycetota bacterium]